MNIRNGYEKTRFMQYDSALTENKVVMACKKIWRVSFLLLLLKNEK
jgi:hypothetical protein